MNATILSDFQEKTFNNQKRIKALHENVRKLTNYAIRTGTKVIKNNNLLQYNALIFSHLYLFSTKLIHLYNHAKQEKKILPSTIKALERLFMLFTLFYDVYYKKTLEKIQDILSIKEKLEEDLNQIIDKGNGRLLLQISMAMRCIHDSIGALIGNSIEQSKEKEKNN